MKIDMNRSQSKNFMGVTKFRVDVKFIPSSEELAKIKEYKLGKKEIAFDSKNSKVWRDVKMGHTINDLMKGVTYESKHMEEIIAFEEAFTEAAQYVKGYIEAGGVKGRQVIEV